MRVESRASATKQQDRTGELAPAAARQRERIQPRLSTPRGRLPTPSGRSCGRGEIADRAPAPPTSVNAVAVYRDRKKLLAPDIANQDFSEARALELLLELQIDRDQLALLLGAVGAGKVPALMIVRSPAVIDEVEKITCHGFLLALVLADSVRCRSL